MATSDVLAERINSRLEKMKKSRTSNRQNAKLVASDRSFLMQSRASHHGETRVK